MCGMEQLWAFMTTCGLNFKLLKVCGLDIRDYDKLESRFLKKYFLTVCKQIT